MIKFAKIHLATWLYWFGNNIAYGPSVPEFHDAVSKTSLIELRSFAVGFSIAVSLHGCGVPVVVTVKPDAPEPNLQKKAKKAVKKVQKKPAKKQKVEKKVSPKPVKEQKEVKVVENDDEESSEQEEEAKHENVDALQKSLRRWALPWYTYPMAIAGAFTSIFLFQQSKLHSDITITATNLGAYAASALISIAFPTIMAFYFYSVLKKIGIVTLVSVPVILTIASALRYTGGYTILVASEAALFLGGFIIMQRKRGVQKAQYMLSGVIFSTALTLWSSISGMTSATDDYDDGMTFLVSSAFTLATTTIYVNQRVVQKKFVAHLVPIVMAVLFMPSRGRQFGKVILDVLLTAGAGALGFFTVVQLEAKDLPRFNSGLNYGMITAAAVYSLKMSNPQTAGHLHQRETAAHSWPDVIKKHAAILATVGIFWMQGSRCIEEARRLLILGIMDPVTETLALYVFLVIKSFALDGDIVKISRKREAVGRKADRKAAQLQELVSNLAMGCIVLSRLWVLKGQMEAYDPTDEVTPGAAKFELVSLVAASGFGIFSSEDSFRFFWLFPLILSLGGFGMAYEKFPKRSSDAFVIWDNSMLSKVLT